MALPVLLALHACIPGRARLPAEPPFPPDLSIALTWGTEGGPRTELFLGRAPDGQWRARVRAAAGGEWPARFLRTHSSRVTPETLARLARGIERSGFFTLPPILEPTERGEFEPVVVRVRQWNRVHQVLAKGRSLPPLVRALGAIDDALQARLPRPPKWLSGFKPRGDGRVGLGDGSATAIRFHEQWFEHEPARTSLLVDLYVLHLDAGNAARAAATLERLRDDPDLGGLVPELRRLRR